MSTEGTRRDAGPPASARHDAALEPSCSGAPPVWGGLLLAAWVALVYVAYALAYVR